MRKNSAPNNAKNANAMDALAALKRRSRNSRSCSIGCVVRSSQATNSVRKITAAANMVRVGAAVQPLVGASMIA